MRIFSPLTWLGASVGLGEKLKTSTGEPSNGGVDVKRLAISNVCMDNDKRDSRTWLTLTSMWENYISSQKIAIRVMFMLSIYVDLCCCCAHAKIERCRRCHE